MGLLCRLFLCLMFAQPAIAGGAWRVAETAHFRVHSQSSVDHLMEQVVLLEEFDRLLRARMGRGPEGRAPPVDVYLVPSMEAGSPWRSLGASVAGFYRADRGAISIVALDRSGDAPAARELTGHQILLHEYTHHFLLGSAGFAYPAWYTEGIAEYFSTVRFLPDALEIGAISDNRRAWLSGHQWLPLERVLAATPTLGEGADSTMFYAQSWLVTHYLLRTPGMRDRLVRYLNAVAEGADPVVAFRRHIDHNLASFERRLHEHLKAPGFIRIARPVHAAPATEIRVLPRSADALLMRFVALSHGSPESRTVAALADVRARAAAWPGDPLAMRTLALAELQHGNRAEARTLLDGLLAQAADDPDLLRWRALAAGQGADGAIDARRNLLHALEKAPDDWRALHAYARLYQPLQGPLPSHALDALLRSLALAPQVAEIRLDAAVALAQAWRLRETAQLLAPLAHAPEAGQPAVLAARMLGYARAGDRAGLLQVAATQQQQAQARLAAIRGGPPAQSR